MEKRTINMTTAKGSEEVTGELIKFPNYDEFEFIVHENNNGWMVLEASTGLMLPQQYQCNNKKDCVTQAEIMLNSTTQTVLRDLIRKSVVKLAYINEN